MDPDSGERYPDVIMFWVESEAEKAALVQDAWLSRASDRRAQAWLDGQPSR
jgi:hypothetical protein